VVTWRAEPSDAPAALALLTEYFSDRERGFTGGTYRVTFPDPACFTPPVGVFIVASDEGADVGCGGIRSVPPSAEGRIRFEVKHLWMRPHTRGRGFGRALLSELERRARAFGAEEVVLDTNDSLEAAGALYRSSGYESIAPYNDNPNATTWYRKRW
jgi:ribosomal protein S18 acetylase RimI-like enzyme